MRRIPPTIPSGRSFTREEQIPMALAGVLSRTSKGGALPRPRQRYRLTPYLFLLPFGLLFLLFFVAPVLYAIYESLFRLQRTGLGLAAPTVTYDGLNNYQQVIHDPNFCPGVGSELLYGVVQVPLILGIALLLALLLDSPAALFK